MSFLKNSLEFLLPIVPLLATSTVVGVALWGAYLLLIRRGRDLGNEQMFSRQLIMLGLTLISIVGVVLSLPVSEGSRGQVIGLIGLVISGIFAFSSSTIFANLVSGIMLRITKPFRTGDFIKVGDYFGRVVERGLLDTEVQSECRELLALPNTFLIANPVSVIRSSGTIVSTTLSLGYDVHHSRIEALLIQAADDCGLEEPFVQILELGNFSVTYRINGMLKEVKSLLTTRSNLSRSVLDVLHESGIEIMSPAFMNQRRLPEDTKIIPSRHIRKSPEKAAARRRPSCLTRPSRLNGSRWRDRSAETEFRGIKRSWKARHPKRIRKGLRRKSMNVTNC